jgi:hypothetical protein
MSFPPIIPITRATKKRIAKRKMGRTKTITRMMSITQTTILITSISRREKKDWRIILKPILRFINQPWNDEDGNQEKWEQNLPLEHKFQGYLQEQKIEVNPDNGRDKFLLLQKQPSNCKKGNLLLSLLGG